MQVVLLFSFYYSADIMALKLKVSTMHKNVMRHLWKMCIRKFCGKFMPSAENKYSVLETLFLVCLTLVETEGLTRGCPLFVQPELPITNCVSSVHQIMRSGKAVASHCLMKCHMWDQADVESEDNNKSHK